MANYILQISDPIVASAEAKVTVDGPSSLPAFSGSVVIAPLRKSFISVDPYEIKNGIPQPKSVASASFFGSGSVSLSKETSFASDPRKISTGANLRWAISPSNVVGDNIGYWLENSPKSGTFVTAGTAYWTATVTSHGLVDGQSFDLTGATLAPGSVPALNGRYFVESVVSANSFTFYTPGYTTTTTFYGYVAPTPSWESYPTSENVNNSWNWNSPSVGAAYEQLSTGYSATTQGSYSELLLSTVTDNWFFPGLTLTIPSTVWGGNTYWTGKDGGNTYTIQSIKDSKSFAVLAKPGSQPQTPSYTIVSGSYIYPDVSAKRISQSFVEDGVNYTYNKIDLSGNSLKHLYASKPRISSVDEFSLAFVLNPEQTSDGSPFAILSGADTSWYDNGSYNFSSDTNVVAATIYLAGRTNGVVSLSVDSSANFSVGQIITVDSGLMPINGTFSVSAFTPGSAGTYAQVSYELAGANFGNTASGYVYLSAVANDGAYKTATPFIWQDGGDIYFGDNQSSPEIVKAGKTVGTTFPNIYVLTCGKNIITMHVSNSYGINSKTVERTSTKNRRNLVSNPDFETNASGWTGGSRATTAPYVGSYCLGIGPATAYTDGVLSFSQDSLGVLTVTTDVAHGLSVGNFVSISGFSATSVTNLNANSITGEIATVPTTTSFTIKRAESNSVKSTYTATSWSDTTADYRLCQSTINDSMTLVSGASYGVSFAAINPTAASSTYYSAAFIKYYNSGGSIISTVCLGNIESNSVYKVGGGSDLRNKYKIKATDVPAGAVTARLVIVYANDGANSMYIDAIVVEPNNPNFNYFYGNGPKYDLDYVIGRKTADFDPDFFYTGTISEIDYWSRELNYDEVRDLISKFRTVYGG